MQTNVYIKSSQFLLLHTNLLNLSLYVMQTYEYFKFPQFPLFLLNQTKPKTLNIHIYRYVFL